MHALALARVLEVAGERQQPLAAALVAGGRQAQCLLGERDRLRAGAAGGRVRGGRCSTSAASAASGSCRGQREVERALLRLADASASAACSCAPLASGARLARAAAASNGWAARTRSPSATQQAGVERVLDGRRAADRLQRVDVQAGAERDREQQPARRARQAGHARAEQVLDRGRDRQSSSAPGRPCSASIRPISSANSGLPSVASTIRRSSGAGRRRPSRSASRRRVALDAQRHRPRALQRPRSRACSSTRLASRAGGRAGTRPARPRSRRAANASASADGASSHWMSSTATSDRGRARPARCASASPIACGSGGAPSGSRRSSATSSAARCGAGSPVESPSPSHRSISAANESCASAPLGRRTRTPHAALAREFDAGLPQRRLADPGPPASTRPAARSRRDEGAQALEFGLAPDDAASSRLHDPTVSDRLGYRAVQLGCQHEDLDRVVGLEVAVAHERDHGATR